MRVTQSQIAGLLGLHVSSVCKILNKTPGPVFHQDTVKAVFKAAKRLGFDFNRASKGFYRGQLAEARTALAMLRDEVGAIPAGKLGARLRSAYKRASSVLARKVAQ